MKPLAITGLMLITTVWCCTRTLPGNAQDLSRLADELTTFQDENAGDEALYENLAQAMAHPLDLNSASDEALRQLHILSASQVMQLLAYIKQQGALLSIHELQAVPGLDRETLYRLLPHVYVADAHHAINRSLWQRVRATGHSYVATRYERTLQTKRGFADMNDSSDNFKGSADRVYLRLRAYKPKDFSVGLTAEKDAGEQLRWNATRRQYGFDYLSYHLQLQEKGRIKTLIAGDYQCQFAQGLILGGAFGLGKGAETITATRRNNVGLIPHSSVSEFGFYRGIAATCQFNRVFVTGFYGNNRRDATLQASDDGTSSIIAFQQTGLHRSEQELSHRHNTTEKNYGAVINYQPHYRLDAGVIFHAIRFSASVNKRPAAYNTFAFSGNHNTTVGAFMNYTVANFSFFSEVARTQRGGAAVVAGVLGSLHPRFDISVVFRKYDEDYHSFYSNAFAENTKPENETGLYWGWKYLWGRGRQTLSGYIDLFRFPWLAYRRYAPAPGHEWLLAFRHQPRRNIAVVAQVREEAKARNSAANEALYTLQWGLKRNYRLGISYPAGARIKLKTCLQYSTYSVQSRTTGGSVLWQDISYDIGRLEVTARHALFDADDTDNRQYAYENDVWMTFSMPGYDGAGVRNYIMVACKVNRSISLWLRYAITRYSDRNEIGSGPDAIVGNTKKDIKFQALIRF